MELKEALRYNYLLNGLSAKEVEKVAALATVKYFDGGDVIVRQFDRAGDVMVILDGEVRVNTFHGEKLAEGGPGWIIGEMSLIDDKPRSATVVSIGKSTVGVIQAKKFWELLQDDADLARKVLFNIAHMLSTRLRVANVHIDTLMGKKP
jgi:CRP-like cAMP-binding protein